MPGLRLAAHRQATIGEVLSGMVRDPKLAAVLLGQSGDYGLPPSKVSALLHLGLAGHYFRGAFYPHGGGQVIADRLVERIEACGGSVHLRSPVERILVEGGRAVGLRLAPRAANGGRGARREGGLQRRSKATLWSWSRRHLPDGATTAPGAWRWPRPCSCLRRLRGHGRELGMTSTNIWQFDGYDVESFYREDRADGPIAVHGCYVTSASLKDPTHAAHHAPAGHTNVEVMAVVPADAARWGASNRPFDWSYKHDQLYRARKGALEEELVGRLDRLFPGAAERVVLRESATPISTPASPAQRGTGSAGATPAQFRRVAPYRGPGRACWWARRRARTGIWSDHLCRARPRLLQRGAERGPAATDALRTRLQHLPHTPAIRADDEFRRSSPCSPTVSELRWRPRGVIAEPPRRRLMGLDRTASRAALAQRAVGLLVRLAGGGRQRTRSTTATRRVPADMGASTVPAQGDRIRRGPPRRSPLQAPARYRAGSARGRRPTRCAASAPAGAGVRAGAGTGRSAVMELAHFAALTAELTVHPHAVERARSRYGLDDAGHRAVVASWQSRFSAEPALYQQYSQLFAHYHAWFAQQAG